MEKDSQLPNWITRGISEYFPSDHSDNSLIKRIKSTSDEGNKLRIKLGIDPTGTDIHIGHSILFRKLRSFQDQGHTAVLIIGDFTAQIGDPTGKNKTRIQISKQEVLENSKTYLQQLGLGKPPNQSILDFETEGRIEIRYNSEWLNNLNLNLIIELMSSSTVGQMLAKE